MIGKAPLAGLAVAGLLASGGGAYAGTLGNEDGTIEPASESLPIPPPEGTAETWPSAATLDTMVMTAGLDDDTITWVVAEIAGPHWGWAETSTSTITIDPGVPAADVTNIALHEWAHIHHTRVYGGDWQTSRVEADAVFGTDRGEEYAADCIARLRGATWTPTATPCDDPNHRAAAQLLLNGERLFG